jgi:hypothetical protein
MTRVRHKRPRSRRVLSSTSPDLERLPTRLFRPLLRLFPIRRRHRVVCDCPSLTPFHRPKTAPTKWIRAPCWPLLRAHLVLYVLLARSINPVLNMNLPRHLQFHKGTNSSLSSIRSSHSYIVVLRQLACLHSRISHSLLYPGADCSVARQYATRRASPDRRL